MDTLKPSSATPFQSLGGQATAIKLRKESLERYYNNPNICKQCGEIIPVGNLQVARMRDKKFCNSQCAANFNKNGSKRIKDRFCILCNSKLEVKRYKNNNKIIHRKFCDDCINLRREKAVNKSHRPIECLFEHQTKESLFSRRKNWQSAASTLRANARTVYDKSGHPKKCAICGYDKHYEVAHKKSVSDFTGTVSVVDINHISNLIALCRNCHWEFDNGFIKLSDSSI